MYASTGGEQRRQQQTEQRAVCRQNHAWPRGSGRESAPQVYHLALKFWCGAIRFTTWDTQAEAVEGEAAARRVMDTVPSAERATFAITREGRSVLIVRALRAELHAGVLRAFVSGAVR